jgi:hypothetical protein
VLGGNPERDVDLNLGWANIHISAKNGQLDIDYRPNEKANTGKREETIGMGEGQIPYQGVEEDRMYAGLTREEKEELQKNPELTVEDFYDERPEEIPDHVTQRMPRQYAQNYVPDELQKVELPQYRYGKIKTYLVNGEHIRNNVEDMGDGKSGVDFTMGGHYYVYPKMIPKNEIWIDDNLDSIDRKATILHEMTERREMSGGMEYVEAHTDYANPPEIVARTNPRLVNQMIRDEMDRYGQLSYGRRRNSEPKIGRPKTVAEIEKEYEKYEEPKEPANLGEDEIAPKYYLGRRVLPKVEANTI